MFFGITYIVNSKMMLANLITLLRTDKLKQIINQLLQTHTTT